MMKYDEKMSGKHIFLSPMSEEDAEIYTVWMNDREITDNLGSSTMVFISLPLLKEKPVNLSETAVFRQSLIRFREQSLVCLSEMRRTGTKGMARKYCRYFWNIVLIR